jgi:cyclophilin family peptidyl-prolyl cis-trans isomerase
MFVSGCQQKSESYSLSSELSVPREDALRESESVNQSVTELPPTTNDEPQTTNDQLHTTNDEPQTTNDQPQTAEDQSEITNQISSLESIEGETMETVVFETSMGKIEVALDRKNAPITVENFIKYVKSSHFDGTIFHRVMPNFMVQGGGFTIAGKEKPTQKPIVLEAGLKNKRGTVAMARTPDADSATCQFFVNLVDNDFLNKAPGNPGYAVFGKVTSGMDVVDKIAAVKTKSNGPHDDWPVDNVIITKAYMKGE